MSLNDVSRQEQEQENQEIKAFDKFKEGFLQAYASSLNGLMVNIELLVVISMILFISFVFPEEKQFWRLFVPLGAGCMTLLKSCYSHANRIFPERIKDKQDWLQISRYYKKQPIFFVVYCFLTSQYYDVQSISNQFKFWASVICTFTFVIKELSINRQPRFYHQKTRICRDLWLLFFGFQAAQWFINAQLLLDPSFLQFFVVFELVALFSSIVRCVSFSCSENKTFEIIYFQMVCAQHIKYFCLLFYNIMSTDLLILLLVQTIIYIILWIKYRLKIVRIYYWDISRTTVLQTSSTTFFDSQWCSQSMTREIFCRKASLIDKLKIHFQDELCNKCALRRIDSIWPSCFHASVCLKCAKEMLNKGHFGLRYAMCPFCNKLGVDRFYRILPNQRWFDFWSKTIGLQDESRIKKEFQAEFY